MKSLLCATDEIEEAGPITGVVQIERDATGVATVSQPGSRTRAIPWCLHVQDVCTELCEQMAAQQSTLVGKTEYPMRRQHGLPPFSPIREVAVSRAAQDTARGRGWRTTFRVAVGPQCRVQRPGGRCTVGRLS